MIWILIAIVLIAAAAYAGDQAVKMRAMQDEADE